MSTVIPKDCDKFEFLTKEIVYEKIKKFSDSWKASHDEWYRFHTPYSNACGYDVNVIGDEYSKINQDTFKVVVYALYFNDESEELETDYNHVVFSFLIDGECTEYSFSSLTNEASLFIESMPTLFINWDAMSKKECAICLTQAGIKRDLMYKYDICGTFELECDMRELALVLAELVLEEDVCTGTSLDALVGLIENELQGVTPSREELHTLVNKYCSPCDDLNDIIKSIECRISFSMEVGVLVS